MRRSRRRLFGGIPGAGLLKPFLLVAVVLALVVWIDGDAEAASKPRSKCSAQIGWDHDSLYGPETAAQHIGWAYQQVAGVTGTQAFLSDSEDVRFEWHNELSGSTYMPGQSYEDGNVWVHAYEGVLDAPANHYRREILASILTDFGIGAPTSTGTGLSPQDRQALQRICKQQAAAAAAPKENTKPKANDSKDSKDSKPAGDTETDEPSDSDRPAAATDPASKEIVTSGPTAVISAVVVALVGLALIGYVWLGDQLLTRVRRMFPSRKARAQAAAEAEAAAYQAGANEEE